MSSELLLVVGIGTVWLNIMDNLQLSIIFGMTIITILSYYESKRSVIIRPLSPLSLLWPGPPPVCLLNNYTIEIEIEIIEIHAILKLKYTKQ